MIPRSIPVPIVALTGLSLALSLATGGYATIKPSLFLATLSAMACAVFLYCLKKEIRQPIALRMVTIAVALPLLAWSLPALWLLFVIMCLWVPIAAGGRFELFAPVYLFSLLLLPALEVMMKIGSLDLMGFSVHNGLAVGAAAAIFLNPAKPRSRLEWDVVALSVVVLIALALVRGTSMSHHIRMLLKIVMDLGLPYYIVSRGLRDSNSLRLALVWLAAGGIILAAILGFEVLKGWPIYNQLYHIYQVPATILVKARAGMLRAGGPFVEPTSAAMLLSLCTVALYVGRDFFRTRWHYFLMMGAALAGLMMPQSRGAWIGLCVAVALCDLMRGRYFVLTAKALALGGFVSLMFLGAAFSPYLSEQLGLSGGSRDTTDYRQLLLDRGMQEFWHHPFTGASMPDLTVRLADLVQGEGIVDFVNTYLWIALISGLIGLFIFIGAFIYFLVKIATTGRFKGRRRRDVEAGVFAFATIAMFMEMFFFTSFGTLPAVFAFVLFGFAAAFIRQQQPVRRARRRATEPVAETPMVLSLS